MITFGKAFAIGNGSELKKDIGIYKDGKELGRIYFMPLSFNVGYDFQVTLEKVDCGFFKSAEEAKSFVNTGLPKGKKYY